MATLFVTAPRRDDGTPWAHVAVADSNTDSTAALGERIAAAQDGDVVAFPSGRFVLGGEISLGDRHVTVCGAATGAPTIWAPTGTGIAIREVARGIALRHLIVDPGGSTTPCLTMSGSGSIEASYLQIRGAAGGVVVDGPRRVHWLHCTVDGGRAGSHGGLQIRSDGEVHLAQCGFRALAPVDPTSDGTAGAVTVRGGARVEVTQCTFEDCAPTSLRLGSGRSSVTQSTFRRRARPAVSEIEATGPILVAHNRFEAAGPLARHSDAVIRSGELVAAGNVFALSEGARATHLMATAPGPAPVTISHNRITGRCRHVVRLEGDGPLGGLFDHNDVDDCDAVIDIAAAGATVSGVFTHNRHRLGARPLAVRHPDAQFRPTVVASNHQIRPVAQARSPQARIDRS